MPPTRGPAHHFISFSSHKRPQQDHGLPLLPFFPMSLKHPCGCGPLLPSHTGLLALLAPSSGSPQPLGTARLQGCSAGGQGEGDDSTSGEGGDSTSGARPPWVTEASLGPGTSTLQEPLKIPCFPESSCQKTSSPPTPPHLAMGSKHQNRH